MWVKRAIDYMVGFHNTHTNYSYLEYGLYYNIKSKQFSIHTFYNYRFQFIQKNEILVGDFSNRGQRDNQLKFLTKFRDDHFLWDFDDLTKEDLKHTNGIGSKYTPFILDLCFYESGCIHDFGYYKCADKNSEKKAWIDKIFLYNMLEQAGKRWWYKCIAYKYYMGVRLFGYTAFKRKE